MRKFRLVLISIVTTAILISAAFAIYFLYNRQTNRAATNGAATSANGIKGLSENIRVRSIVGPLLEHSRVYYFANGGDEEIYIGSSDWMPRNLDRRVEVIAPVENANLKNYLKNEYLAAYLRDNVKARVLKSDGFYHRVTPESNEMEFNCQLSFQSSPKVVRIDSKH